MSFPEVAAFCESLGNSVPVVVVGAGLTWADQGQGLRKPDNVVDLLDQTSLSQLIWLMRQARFIVSVDSGPMHLGAAITGNLLSLHTWTDPLMVGPWRKDAWIWREGCLIRVGEVEKGQFPERRSDRDRYAGGILSPGDAETLAAFVGQQFGP